MHGVEELHQWQKITVICFLQGVEVTHPIVSPHHEWQPFSADEDKGGKQPCYPTVPVPEGGICVKRW